MIQILWRPHSFSLELKSPRAMVCKKNRILKFHVDQEVVLALVLWILSDNIQMVIVLLYQNRLSGYCAFKY